jgi:hypothetical protein
LGMSWSQLTTVIFFRGVGSTTKQMAISLIGFDSSIDIDGGGQHVDSPKSMGSKSRRFPSGFMAGNA